MLIVNQLIKKFVVTKNRIVHNRYHKIQQVERAW